MKTIILSILMLFAFTLSAVARTVPRVLTLDHGIEDTSRMTFIEHGSGLALNVEYEEVKRLRKEIASALEMNRPLKFLTSWDPAGEAHVTTITPPEFSRMKGQIDLATINRIAGEMDIQGSDLKVLGLGSGKKRFGREEGETFFIIVRSERLLSIRRAIYREFLSNGGDPGAFNPEWFYPHITIGYTHEDIHEPDVIKSIEKSADPRFKLQLQ